MNLYVAKAAIRFPELRAFFHKLFCVFRAASVMENRAGGLERRNNSNREKDSDGGGGGGGSNVNGKGSSYHRLLIGRVDPRTTMAMYFDGPPKSPSNMLKKKRGSGRRSRDGDSGEDDQGFGEEEASVGRGVN